MLNFSSGAIRIFLATGILSRACTRGFWSLFFLRLVTEVELEPLQLVLLGTVMELSILIFEMKPATLPRELGSWPSTGSRSKSRPGGSHPGGLLTKDLVPESTTHITNSCGVLREPRSPYP